MGDLNYWARGDRIGPFTVRRRLGEGWEAVVLLVRDERDGQLRTLKLFKRTNVLATVLHTVKHWERFRGLDGVKQCLDWGLLGGQRRVGTRPYMVMEYVPGMTLAEKIAQGRICDPTALTISLLEALAPIHARGLGIGDLDKGRNVIVEEQTGRLVFVDMDAGGPCHPPPDIYEDLLEVLWLARQCSDAKPPARLIKVLTEAPDASGALLMLSAPPA
jgi:hypothetical protein